MSPGGIKTRSATPGPRREKVKWIFDDPENTNSSSADTLEKTLHIIGGSS